MMALRLPGLPTTKLKIARMLSINCENFAKVSWQETSLIVKLLFTNNLDRKFEKGIIGSYDSRRIKNHSVWRKFLRLSSEYTRK